MATQNFFWGSNIQFLRKRLNHSQEELALKLNITRSKLAAHESGKTANPPVDDLYRFSSFFRISIDALLKVNLAKLGELKLRELEAGNDVYTSGGNMRVLAITVDKNNRENMEYVPVKAKAGYRSAYQDPEFIASLPKFDLPNLPNGTFRMFPTVGDSMLPIPEGSDIICQYVENWQDVKARTLCILILNGEQDFVFKQATFDGKTFLLESLNPNYAPYLANAEDVLEVWKFHSFHATRLPSATTLNDLMQTLGELKSDIAKISGKI